MYVCVCIYIYLSPFWFISIITPEARYPTVRWIDLSSCRSGAMHLSLFSLLSIKGMSLRPEKPTTDACICLQLRILLEPGRTLLITLSASTGWKPVYNRYRLHATQTLFCDSSSVKMNLYFLYFLYFLRPIKWIHQVSSGQSSAQAFTTANNMNVTATPSRENLRQHGFAAANQ